MKVVRTATEEPGAAALGAQPHCPVCGSSACQALALGGRSVYRCKDPSCDLRFAFPPPSDAELREIYSEEHRRGDTGATPDVFAEALVEALQVCAGGLNGRRVLDFGAGVGTVTRHLIDTGAAVDCVEPSPEGRVAIRSQFATTPVHDVEEFFAQSRPREYDTILLVEVVEHLRDPLTTLERLQPLLSDDGLLLVTTPNIESLKARVQGRHWGMFSEVHLIYFSPTSLRRALCLAGFGGIRPLPAVEHPEYPRPRRLLQSLLRSTGLSGGIQLTASAAR